VFYDLLKMLDMLFIILRVNQDVVKIDNTEVVNIASQSVIDIALEGCWSIG
jgi:hypothetical protein